MDSDVRGDAESGESFTTLGDLINLLGYLQGEVALAIRVPLEELRRHAPGPRTRRLVEEALAAVSTLETEGRTSP